MYAFHTVFDVCKCDIFLSFDVEGVLLIVECSCKCFICFGVVCVACVGFL